MNADDYITFRECAVPDVRKTRIVAVDNKRSGNTLGTIRWYGPWRQYCFFPQGGTIFNTDCMDRITAEVRAMMAARR